jgi:hypothetical protein
MPFSAVCPRTPPTLLASQSAHGENRCLERRLFVQRLLAFQSSRSSRSIRIKIGRPRVPAAAVHAADQAHLLGVDIGLHRVEEIIADVNLDHSADFERRARPERQAGDAAAFEADR